MQMHMKVFLRQNINLVTVWNPFRRTLKFKPAEQNQNQVESLKKTEKEIENRKTKLETRKKK
jgi:hypothetical protein